MAIPIGSNVFAGASGAALKVVPCENCTRTYVYEMHRTRVGEAFSFLSLDGGAEARAKTRAKRDLQGALLSGVDAVPCPAWGWYQSTMIPKVRWRRGKGWLHAGAALLILSAICLAAFSLVTSSPNLRQRPPWVDPLAWSVLLSLAGVGLVSLIIYVVRCLAFDPNAQDVEDRIRIGRERALTKDEAVARGLLSSVSPGAFSWGGEGFKFLRAYFVSQHGVLSIHADGNQCSIDLPRIALRSTARLAELAGQQQVERADEAIFHVLAGDSRHATDRVRLRFDSYDATMSILVLSFEFDDAAETPIHGVLRCQELRAGLAGGFSFQDEWFRLSRAYFTWNDGVLSVHADGARCAVDFPNIAFSAGTSLADLPGQSREECNEKPPFRVTAGERRFKRDAIRLDFEEYDPRASILSLSFLFGNSRQEPIHGLLRCLPSRPASQEVFRADQPRFACRPSGAECVRRGPRDDARFDPPP